MRNRRHCPSCDTKLEMRDQEMDWCPRCAMVDELIGELIRRQIEDGLPESPPWGMVARFNSGG